VTVSRTNQNPSFLSLPSKGLGRTEIQLLKKAADTAKEDCARAMDLAHRLSFQLRAAEERAREAEAETAHFRDRTTRAETWMLRIRDEVEQTFFQRKEREGSLPRTSEALGRRSNS
jgi:hypothetical protein